MSMCEADGCVNEPGPVYRHFCSSKCYQRNYRQTRRGPDSGYWKKYYAEHGEARRGQARDYYDRNRDALLERGRVYAEANRERYLAYYRNYNAERPGRIHSPEELRYKREREAKRRASMTLAVDVHAHRHGLPWTSADDAVAIDETLTVVQAALLIQRTWKAVQGRRGALRAAVRP